MKSKYIFLGIGVLLGVALMITAMEYIRLPYTFRGSLIDPPAQAADFELPDQNGQSFRLSEQKGQIVLLFFGYTHCPDVCPLTLSDFKQIKSELGDQAQQVKFVFITVDPERDTPQVIGNYLQNFDDQFVGLTTDRATLEKVWENYGVYQAKQDVGSASGYLVDHTARTYLIDQQGNWRLTYPFEMDYADIVQDIRHLLSNG